MGRKAAKYIPVTIREYYRENTAHCNRIAATLFSGEVGYMMTRKSHDSFVRGYGPDFFIPMVVYFGLSALNNSDKKDRTRINSAIALGGCFVAETLQYFHLWPGTFDPMDYVAYAAGLAVALGIDSVIGKKYDRLSE